MQLTLLIPELIWPEPEDHATLDGLDCPALATLLTRSCMNRRPAQSFEATLCEQFGQPPAAPFAAFRLLGEKSNSLDATTFNGLCCDPVHLRFHQERLILADSNKLGLHTEEAERLADELNTHLAEIGRFHVVEAGRWYLQLKAVHNHEAFALPPLSAVAGRSVEDIIADAPRSGSMPRLLNEIQMLLHAHPLNQQREDEGRLRINSLWLWGAGTLPPSVECRFNAVWSANPLARGLARAAKVPNHPLPAEAAGFFAQATPDAAHLLVIEDLLEAVQYEQGEAYRSAIAGLEQRWFAPLRQALSSGKIRRLHIVAPTAYATLTWESTRGELWKFWRRPQSLNHLAQALAKDTP